MSPIRELSSSPLDPERVDISTGAVVLAATIGAAVRVDVSGLSPEDIDDVTARLHIT